MGASSTVDHTEGPLQQLCLGHDGLRLREKLEVRQATQRKLFDARERQRSDRVGIDRVPEDAATVGAHSLARERPANSLPRQ